MPYAPTLPPLTAVQSRRRQSALAARAGQQTADAAAPHSTAASTQLAPAVLGPPHICVTSADEDDDLYIRAQTWAPLAEAQLVSSRNPELLYPHRPAAQPRYVAPAPQDFYQSPRAAPTPVPPAPRAAAMSVSRPQNGVIPRVSPVRPQARRQAIYVLSEEWQWQGERGAQATPFYFDMKQLLEPSQAQPSVTRADGQAPEATTADLGPKPRLQPFAQTIQPLRHSLRAQAAEAARKALAGDGSVANAASAAIGDDSGANSIARRSTDSVHLETQSACTAGTPDVQDFPTDAEALNTFDETHLPYLLGGAP